MAIEPSDVRQVVDDALQHKVAECVINGETPSDPFSELARVQTIRKVVARITDQAINDALVALFTEAQAQFSNNL